MLWEMRRRVITKSVDDDELEESEESEEMYVGTSTEENLT
jgi:hypothetical protein